MNPPVSKDTLVPIIQATEIVVLNVILQAVHAHSPWKVPILLHFLAHYTHGPVNAITVLGNMVAEKKATIHRADGTPIDTDAEEGFKPEDGDYVTVEPCTAQELGMDTGVTVEIRG